MTGGRDLVVGAAGGLCRPLPFLAQELHLLDGDDDAGGTSEASERQVRVVRETTEARNHGQRLLLTVLHNIPRS